MIIVYQNELINYIPSVSSEKATFPGTNAYHIHLSVPWRTTGVDDEYYEIDAGIGNTLTVSFAAILSRSITEYKHNLTVDVVAKIQGHPTSSWGSPDVDETIDYNADIMWAFFTPVAKRFWRFYIDDPTNTDGYLDIPKLWLGGYLTVGEYPDSNMDTELVDPTITQFSNNSQGYSDIYDKYRIARIGMGTLKETTRQQLLTVAANAGKHTPVIIFLDENNTDILPPMHCQMLHNLKFRHSGGYSWKDEAMELREVS